MKGWVYILTNESMPDIFKLGFSAKDPESRAEELNNTSIPTPFKVAYELLIENPHDIEKNAHKQLVDFRINNNREFFKCSVNDATKIVQSIVKEPIYENIKPEYIANNKVSKIKKKTVYLNDLIKK